MKIAANSVTDYVSKLPPDRRDAIEQVRAVMRKNLDKDYEEGLTYGMIGYYVPHSIFPAGYHCDPRQPLPFAGLASQKNHMSLYLMCTYGDATERTWFENAWKKSGKKLDMGKACIRFKKIEDLALDVIAESVRRVPAKKYIARYLELLGSTKSGAKMLKKAEASKKASPAKASKETAKKTTKKATKKTAK